MEAFDYPIHHFQHMGQLSESLKELPAEVRDHRYSYETFGSWTMVVRYKGVRIRVAFDGRDSAYSVERSSSRKSPDQWEERVWLEVSSSSDEFPVSTILDGIMSCAKAI